MKRLPKLECIAINLLTAVFLLFPLSQVFAKAFVSFNGQFHIKYPDSWEQIDYRSVDYYLTQNSPNRSLLDYEGVFAPVSTKAFYDEPYLLLTIDNIGELIGPTRDSALASIASSFSGLVDSVKSDQVLGLLTADKPLYVPEKQMVVVQTDIHEGRTVTKRNLLIIRFGQRGLANFYFYASDSLWTSSLTTFFQIAESFTPGTQPTDMPKETLKVADLSKEDSSSQGISRYWPVPSGMIVIFIAIWAAHSRRRRRRDENAASKS